MASLRCRGGSFGPSRLPSCRPFLSFSRSLSRIISFLDSGACLSLVLSRPGSMGLRPSTCRSIFGVEGLSSISEGFRSMGLFFSLPKEGLPSLFSNPLSFEGSPIRSSFRSKGLVSFCRTSISFKGESGLITEASRSLVKGRILLISVGLISSTLLGGLFS